MPVCTKSMSFDECELAILRSAVDKIDHIKGKTLLNNDSVKNIVNIVENFIIDNKLICYGGTAINNILPKKEQFYNKDIEIPDYDFFSPTPLEHAKKLADIYYKLGYKEVEAKSGVHPGTFKVFVNYLPIADITYLVPELFNSVKKEAVVVDKIYYSPPNFLRMLMYLELSRPAGNVSRWEKVLKRLTLLNKNYPLIGKNCNSENIQRIFETGVKQIKKKLKKNQDVDKIKTREEVQELLFINVLDTLIENNCVFFGAYANHNYFNKINQRKRKKKILNKKIPDFDVLAEDPKIVALLIQQRLKSYGFLNVTIKKRKGVGEVIAPHYEVKFDKETLLFIYQPLACHSYNEIKIEEKKIRIATIDTMLSFYLAFLFINRNYYEKNRILCMCEYLFKAQQKNRLRQTGLLKRFSINCIGKQKTLEIMRAEKSEMYHALKNKRGTKEYEWWFLRYIPEEIKKKQRRKKRNKTKRAKKVKKSKKNKTKKK